jgi:hypothetical protein
MLQPQHPEDTHRKNLRDLEVLFQARCQLRAFQTHDESLTTAPVFVLQFMESHAHWASDCSCSSTEDQVPATTILFVDDESSILAGHRVVLESMGYSVLTADSGAKALSFCDRIRSMRWCSTMQ